MGRSNEGNETNNSLDNKMIKANEQDDGKHAQDDLGQGDQGEYEQQYGKKIVATYLFNIHT